MIEKGYGYKRDRHDVRDRLFKPRAVRPGAFPDVVDLRQGRPKGLEQGRLGSCVIHSVTCVLRRHLILAGSIDYPLSRLALYWRTRELEGCVDEDSGVEIRDCIKIVRDEGVGREDLWPYDVSRFKERPPPTVEIGADIWGDFTYERVEVSNHGLKSALVEGHPVIIGTALFESFDSGSVERTGIIPMPTPGERETFGHAMTVFGYGQVPGHYTSMNWWGEDWGDKGDCYIPEAYLASPTYSSDFWVIKNIDVAGK